MLGVRSLQQWVPSLGYIQFNTGIQFVQPVMDQGWNLCLFDFAGSGIS